MPHVGLSRVDPDMSFAKFTCYHRKLRYTEIVKSIASLFNARRVSFSIATPFLGSRIWSEKIGTTALKDSLPPRWPVTVEKLSSHP
jgi:hypothetical protein